MSGATDPAAGASPAAPAAMPAAPASEPVAAPAAPAATPELAPAPAEAAAPAASAPAAEPAAPAAAEPAAPAAPEAAAAEAPKPAEPAKEPEKPKPASSLLAEAGKEPEKPAEAAPAADKPAAEAEPLPTFAPFKLPEGVKADGKGMGEFTTLLGQFERDTKIDHRLVEELGQKALDIYVADMQRLLQSQQEAFQQTRRDWVKTIKEDPVLGRNRHETVMRDAARVRDMFATDRFREMIDFTGAGDHPGMLDFVYNVARFLDRHGLLREGTPVPAPKPAALPTPRTSRSRYTSSQGAS